MKTNIGARPLETAKNPFTQFESEPMSWGPPDLLEVAAEVKGAVLMTLEGLVAGYQQTLDGSFSAVSTPFFATKYSF